MKKRVLLLFTNHRVAEKLWPIIPELASDYTIDLFCIGLFSKETPWVGDVDERDIKINKYREYIDHIIYGPGLRYHGDSIKDDLASYVDLSLYHLVIYDDNRRKSEYNIPNFYSKCKKHNITVVGNSHGNEDRPHQENGVAYDFAMDFQTGGIPANDTLISKKRGNKHILIIANFLGNRASIFPVNFDKFFIDNCGIRYLQEKYNCPVKVKIKTRLDKPDYTNDIKYVNDLLDCEVIANTDDIDQLIADSIFVIAAPSTLCFKSIQLGIPTILIRGAGAIGNFKDYPGLVNLNKQEVINSLEEQFEHGRYTDYIAKTIAGGDAFSSSTVYVQELHKRLKGHNKLVVYTALFTDDIKQVHGLLPEYNVAGIEFICFTNTPYLKSNTWDIRVVDLEGGARKTARKYKTLPHKYLPDYGAWIWMDNSCIFKYHPRDLFDYYMNGYDMCVHEHCDRTSIIDEARIILEYKLDDPDIVNLQLTRYLNNGYQETGLYETGILMRRNTNKIINFNKMWWNEIKNNSIRDQISFPYILWQCPEISLYKIKETFVAHHSELNKKQSEHFETVPKNIIKLNENNL